MRNASLVLLTAMTVCAPAAAKPAAAPGHWQQVIRADDRKRLAGLWSAWTRSLGETRAAGKTAALAELGPVAMPDAARAAAFPGPGTYFCRTVKLGAQTGGAEVLSAGPFKPCAVSTTAGGALRFEQLAGGRRIAGLLYPDGDRMVFLGALALGQEMGVMAYGEDGDRDQVGVLRAYGNQRWRLELPWPKWESTLDLIEIVATDESAAADM